MNPSHLFIAIFSLSLLATASNLVVQGKTEELSSLLIPILIASLTIGVIWILTRKHWKRTRTGVRF